MLSRIATLQQLYSLLDGDREICLSILGCHPDEITRVEFLYTFDKDSQLKQMIVDAIALRPMGKIPVPCAGNSEMVNFSKWLMGKFSDLPLEKVTMRMVNEKEYGEYIFRFDCTVYCCSACDCIKEFGYSQAVTHAIIRDSNVSTIDMTTLIVSKAITAIARVIQGNVE